MATNDDYEGAYISFTKSALTYTVINGGLPIHHWHTIEIVCKRLSFRPVKTQI
jgi:hypothetical protein